VVILRKSKDLLFVFMPWKNGSLYLAIWRFPFCHRGTPVHHPFSIGMFREINNPAIKGHHHDLGNLHTYGISWGYSEIFMVYSWNVRDLPGHGPAHGFASKVVTFSTCLIAKGVAYYLRYTGLNY